MRQKQNNYAFIDSQNLNLGVRSQGWKLDFYRFRQFIKDKYQVENAYLFIGFVPHNQLLYTDLQESGYICIFKPTLELPAGEIKGNVDAELVLHTMIQLQAFAKALIVSGDGDFHCLVEYLLEQKKLLALMVPNRKKYSGLLKRKDFLPYIRFAADAKNKVQKERPQ